MVGLQDDDHEDDRGQTYNDIEAGPSSSTERSSSPRDEHDYTENASAADIAQAIEQQRMEGEEVIGQNMEGGGPDSGSAAIWSGEAGFSVPSSITSMHFMNQARRPSMASLRRSSSQIRTSYNERRYSRDVSRSRRNSGNYSDYGDHGQGYDDYNGRPRIFRDDSRRSRRSNALSDGDGDWEEGPLDADEIAPPSPGLLPRIASALGFHQNRDDDADEEAGGAKRRRSSRGSQYARSRRTSGSSYRRSISSARSRTSIESEENWGYSSNERDTYSEISERDRDDDDQSFRSSLADDTSLPPQSRPSSPIPLLPSDGIFGDPSAPNDTSSIQLFTDVSSSSKQTISLPDEDLSIRFTGYVTAKLKSVVWVAGCVVTLGGLGLVGRWVPAIWVKWCGRETDFETSGKDGWLVVETPYGDLHIIQQDVVPYPYPLSTVFPQALTGGKTGTNVHSRAPTVASTNGSRAPSIMAAAVARSHVPTTVMGDDSNGNISASNSISTGAGGAKDLMTVDLEQGQTSFEETMGYLKTAEYRYTKFALQPGTGKWCLIRDWRDPKWTSVKAVASGLGKDVREQRRILFGDNVIDIEGKGVVGLLLDEVLHPFYVFQIASIALWSIDDYYYYAFAIALISVSSILSTLIETKRTIERMREMSRFSCDVRVLVDGEWTTMDSASLVPGDVFEASDPSLTVFPCDALLLSGDAIVNESMLTGESVPVSKVPVKDDVIRSLAREEKKGSTEVDAEIAKHYLFSGTKIIRVRPGGSIMGLSGKSDAQRALAMVTRTGFNTTKGALVRSMLFPKPMGFKFYRDSMRFIGVLAMIAGFGFAISAVQFVRMGIAWYTILIRALDLITIVVPPALPATLTIGTTFAIDRLRKLGVFCISPNRVNIGGKVNVFAFDKTGTLTEDGLDVLGVRTVDKYSERFSELHGEVDEVPDRGGLTGKTPLLYALATCHSLKLIDGEILGDPLDIKMFEWTGWTLDEGRSKPAAAANGDALSKEARVVDRPQTLVQTVVRPPGAERWKLEDALKSGGKHAHFLELGVIRTFDFVSALRRMSVIVKRLKANSMEIYVKGAPEVMPDICDPETFPSDYDDMLSYYTRNGFRVIAIAGKSVEGLTWLKAQRMKREQAESGLHFLGFIVFENKLKEATTPAIHALRSAHIACRMVTGDNVRTAISVARECGLVSHSASVYIPTFASGGGHNPDSEITWTSVDDEKHKLDSYSLKPIVQEYALGFDPGETEQPDYQLALTGDVFRWMLEFAPLETMQRMLVKGVIFARMSPDEKAELVERLQALGYTVGFCGDGANDCGALKTADIGISLSEAEASVAAPFTSHITDISCVIEVIKEGRAALVTSFSCFKYMALYSLIQFTTVTLLYSFASSLGDFQFLYIDLFIIIPIAVAMGRTLPYPKIHPKRPTASLVSKKVLTSIIGQTIINFAVQVFVFIWIRRQPWYTEPDVDDEKLETFNYENTALFLVSCFQYILVAVVFSVGPPYRKPIHSNLSLVGCFVVLTAFSSWVLLAPSKSVALVLDIIDLTYRFRFELLAIIIVNIVCCFAFERYAERPLARLVGTLRKWARGKRGGKHNRGRVVSGKAYKAVESNL